MPKPNQIVRLVPPEELAAPSAAAPNVTYHGGPVLTAVEVVTIFWGADWGNAPDSTLAQQINGFFDWIVTSSLMDLVSEYSTSSMRIGHGSRKATFTITTSEPGDAQPGGGRIVSDNQIQTALQGWIGNGTVSATTANTLYFIYLPPNAVSTLPTSTGTDRSCVNYCGYHSNVGNVYYAVMPYLTCDGCTSGTTTFDSLTKVSSHELCEAITDPAGDAWYDDQVSDGEIGDFCNTNVVTLDGFTVQSEWSQQQNRCAVAPNWNRFTLAPAGSAAGTAKITAVSRIPNSMEMWWTGADGSVQDAFWYDGATWQRFPLAPGGRSALAGGVTAVSRIPNSMEVWWIGQDGSVQDAFWYDGASWQNFTLAGPGSASLGGGIKAVSRIPNSMEMWWIGQDGSVQDAFWYDGASWQNFQLAPPGSASQQGGIAGVSRIPGSMEIWWIGQDGSVNDAFWYDGAAWQNFQLAPPGSASPQGGITAVSRIPGSMEIWWIGQDGSVQDAFWYEGSTWQRFTLAPPGSASPQGGITAVSRIPGSMEIWWIGQDGSVQDAFWYG